MKKRRYKYLFLLLILPIIFISSCGKSKKINNNTDVDTTTISTKDTSTSTNQNISTSADDTSTTTQTSVDITTSVDTTTSISTTTETGPIDFQVNYYFESLNSPYNTKLYDLYTTENKNGIISEYDDFNSYDGLRCVNIERNETSIDIYYDRSYAILKVMSNNTSFGTVDKLDIYGNRSMKYQEVAHLKALPNPGYEFENWYVNNSFYSDKSEIDFEMPNHNVTIYANFKYGEFEIIVENETGYEIQGLEDVYSYNDPINLSLVDLPYSYNVIWTFGEEEITSPELHTQMPNNDLYLKVEIIPCRKIENTQYVYFGSYPQTVLDEEEDASLIASLNSKAGTIPTESNNYKWKHYASYYGTNTIWYQDITHNGKKYRGVYFTKNRGSSLTEGYKVNTVYWFSFDPIKWEIFTDEDNKKLLTTDLVLDYMQYASWTNGKVDDGEPYYHNGKTTYACDYECSDVRKWLKEVFYNDAFNDFEKEIINTSYILNQNKYNDYSESTIDKVFLLRQVDLEAKYGVNNFVLIRRLGTNYTNCVGGENRTNPYADPPYTRCYYWTRESCSIPDAVCLDNATTETNYKNGVRPSLWINLDLLNIDDERPTTLNQDGYIDGNNISNKHILECYVSGTYSISGKGTVATVQKINNDALTSGFVRGILRVGDTVYLYTPEGDEYELTVEGLEMFNKMLTEAFYGDSIGILFGDSISKDQLQ